LLSKSKNHIPRFFYLNADELTREEIDKEKRGYVISSAEAKQLFFLYQCFGITFDDFLQMAITSRIELFDLAIDLYYDKAFSRRVFF
jgi:hypothetical protein